jgi:transposase
VLDNGPCHTSKASQQERAARTDWLHVIWLARYSPELNKKEREWRYLKRAARGHLARDRRAFAAAILAGVRRLGGSRLDIIDRVPDWFLQGHRKPPTGRKPGRPKGAKDRYQRSYHRKNLPAHA